MGAPISFSPHVVTSKDIERKYESIYNIYDEKKKCIFCRVYCVLCTHLKKKKMIKGGWIIRRSGL